MLAALNLAYRLTERPAAGAASSAQAHPEAANEPLSPVNGAYIDKLIARLDQALDSDGHLI